MYSIETDLGKFVGENEKEAKAALRKAQKAARVAEQEQISRYQRARLIAQANGYDLYERWHHTKQFPRGWRVLVADESCWSCRRVWHEHRHAWQINTEGEKGLATPYDAITHVIENGAGFAMAIAIANQDCELYAVGVCEGVVSWVPLPGIPASAFHCPSAE